MFKGSKNVGVFRTAEGEQYLESVVGRLLAHLVEIKNGRQEMMRNADDVKLAQYYGQIQNLIERRERIKKKDLHLNPVLKRLFMEGSFSDSASMKKDVVQNAEEWVCIVKKVYEDVNSKSGSFSADKLFWSRFYERVAGLRNFYYSEEYSFLSKCLETNGNIVLKYTLENLFCSEKIYKLACLFVRFYSDVDCDLDGAPHSGHSGAGASRISTGGTGPADGNSSLEIESPAFNDQKMGEKSLVFINSVFPLLKKLRKLLKQPKVVKRTAYRLINLLRIEILKNFYYSAHPGYFELFREYDALVQCLSESVDDTATQYTSIVIEELNDLGRYKWDVQQVCDGLELLNSICPFCSSEIQTELTEWVNVRYERYKHRTYHEIFNRTVEVQDGALDIAKDQGPGLSRPLEESEVFKKAIGFVSERFSGASHEDKLEALSLEFAKYSRFFKYGMFRERTRSTRLVYLGRMSEIFYRHMKNDAPGDMLRLMGTIEKIEEVLAYYEDSIMLGSLKSGIDSSKNRVLKYLDSISYNIKESFVLHRIPCEDGSVQKTGASENIEISSLEHVFEEIKVADKINSYFNLDKIRKTASELLDVEDDYSKIKHIVERYRCLNRQDPELFHSAHVDAFIDGLVDLKWKYLGDSCNQEKYDEINGHLDSIEISNFRFAHVLEKFYTGYLREWYSSRHAFSPDVNSYLPHFEGENFDDRALSSSISRRMESIASIYCDITIEKLENNVVFTRYKMAFDISSLDKYVSASQNPSRAAPDPGFIEHMSSVVHNINASTVENKILRIKELIETKWHGFIDCCFYSEPELDDCDNGDFKIYKNTVRRIAACFNLLENKIPYFDIQLEVDMLPLFGEKAAALKRLSVSLKNRVSELPIHDDTVPADDLERVERFLEHKCMLDQISATEDVFAFIIATEDRLGSAGRNENPGRSKAGIDFNEVIKHETCTDDKTLEAIKHEHGRLSVFKTGVLSNPILGLCGDSPGSHLKGVEQKQRLLTEEYLAIKGEYCGFSADEDSFVADLENLQSRYREMCARIGRFNRLLVHLQRDAIDCAVEIDLKTEFEVYKKYNMLIKDVLGTKMVDLPHHAVFEERDDGNVGGEWKAGVHDEKTRTNGAETDIFVRAIRSVASVLEPCHSGLLKNLCDRVRSYERPFSYIGRLLKCRKHFDVGCLVGEYLLHFDEDSIADVLHKTRCDEDTVLYLGKRELNFWVHAQITHKTRESASGTRSFAIISNLGQLDDRLSSEWADYDLILKFNVYRLYESELKSAEDELSRNARVALLLGDVQPSIMGFENIFTGGVLEKEAQLYQEILQDYERCIVSLRSGASEDPEDALSLIKNSLQTLSYELKAFLSSCREAAPRLFFVSDENIIRTMNDRRRIKDVLTEVFNVTRVLEAAGEIIGIVSQGEEVLLLDKIKMEGSIADIINEFENGLRNRLEAYFVSGSSDGKIAVIDELMSEYLYFGGQPANVGIEKARMDGANVRKIEILRRLFENNPDALGLYPKPTLIGGVLHAGETVYRYEYYPPTSFIFTSLTSQIFSTILLNFRRPGLILYGPSGTGKTETVRYFCRTLGCPLYTFCCSERVEYSSIQNIIAGCAQLGSYVCFDEFNRLRKEVMSAVADCMYEHRDRTRIFLTMNIGYQGRHELPRSLRALFGEARVDHPDLRDIIHHHTGDDRLYDMVTKLSMQCTRQPHYDFGLRAINMIVQKNVNACSETDVALLDRVPTAPYGFDDDTFNGLIFFYMASLIDDDKVVFIRLLKEIYGLEIRADDERLCHASLFEAGLRRRNGMLICGEGRFPMLNKIREWANGPANFYSTGKKVQVFIYNPVNILLRSQSIFGSLDHTTGEWQDSIFTRDLRATDGEAWFVFDGPIATAWVEDFNNILDDNRALCLTTGERIKISPFFRFIFVSQSLEEATPATLTRVFLLHTQSSAEKEPHLHGEEALHAALGTERVLFLVGRRGVGKKTAAKNALGKTGRRLQVLGSTDPETPKLFAALSPSAREVLYVDEFEKAGPGLREIIRELHSYGCIGGTRHRNLTVVCGVDNMDLCECLADAVYIKVEEPDASQMIARYMCSINAEKHQKIVAAVEYIYSTYGLSPHELSRYLHFITDGSCTGSFLYFIFRLLCGDDPVAAGGIGKIFDAPVDADFVFNPTTLTFERCSIDIHLSKVSCLLYHNHSVVLRGPRLCGKRWLVDSALDALNIPELRSRVRIVHWLDRIKLEEPGLYVFLAVERPNKEVSQRAVEVEIPHREYSLDCTAYLRSLLKTTDDGMPESDPIDSTASGGPTLGVYDDYHHPDSCVHKTMLFDSFYKYIDFKNTLSQVAEEFRAKSTARQMFLRRGIDRISEFQSESRSLAAEIREKKERLDRGVEELNSLIAQLVEEEGVIRAEEEVVCSKKRVLQHEMEASAEKKQLVAQRLRAVEPLLNESKEAIKSITKSHLSEIKVMSAPPLIIRETIECVYYLLEGRHKTEWRELLLYVKGDDFIGKVLSHGSSSNTADAPYDDFVENLLKSGGFTVERADKASKACGALFRWVKACVAYHRVACETGPLEKEIAALEEGIAVQAAALAAEEERLAVLTARLSAHRKRHSGSLLALRNLEDEVSTTEQKATLLSNVVEKLREEPQKWRRMAYECPVSYILSSSFILSRSKNIFCRSKNNALFPKDSVVVSLKDRNYAQVLSAASVYDRNLIITDADYFDRAVYDVLKAKMTRNAGSCAILGFRNHYAAETYEISAAALHDADRVPDTIDGAEQKLLELLEAGEDLSAVALQTRLLDAARETAALERAKTEEAEHIARLYAEISRSFVEAYDIEMSQDVYRTVLESNRSSLHDGKAFDLLKTRILRFYQHSFPGLHLPSFDFEELGVYSFDYTFISSFCDVVFRLKSLITFDEEISAGARERSNALERLLAEKGNKTVLVLNTHFLPPLIKTGTNRFVFIIENGETHALVEDTRIVYYDRDLSYDTIFKSVSAMFDPKSTMVRFHALVLSLGHGFSLGDLETAVNSPGISDEYLRETIYFSRMDTQQRDEVERRWHEIR